MSDTPCSTVSIARDFDFSINSTKLQKNGPTNQDKDAILGLLSTGQIMALLFHTCIIPAGGTGGPVYGPAGADAGSRGLGTSRDGRGPHHRPPRIPTSR